MSATIPLPQTGGLVKPPRDNHHRIFAVSLKPPEAKNVNGQPVYQLRYVSQNNKEIKIPCTPEVFRRVLGTRSKRQAHTGLDMQIYHHFWLVVDRSTNRVVGVDMYPNKVNLHGLPRTDDPSHRCLVLLVNSDTGDMVVEDAPSEVTESHIISLLNILDPLGEIRVGEEYAGFLVESAAGGRLYLNTDSIDDYNGSVNDENIFRAPAHGGDGGSVGMGGIGYSDLNGGGDGGSLGGIGYSDLRG